MKVILNIWTLVLIVVLLTTLSCSANQWQENKTITITVNGSKVKTNPNEIFIIKDRVLIPASLAEQILACIIEQDPIEESIKVFGRRKNILLQINSSYSTVNGETVNLDVAALLKDHKIYIPIRFISENMGAQVHWDGLKQEVIINMEYKSLITPTISNVQYGSYERNVLDFYKAPTTNSTSPVLIFFHGGAFIEGDKTAITQQYPDLLERLLMNGISVVSANYRFVSQAPFPAPMLDGARVVQIVRHKAQEWGVDADKIALSGVSAGANMSLWIAFNDDLAKIESKDPIERYSTKVSCVLAYEAQTSNDIAFIYEHIYRNKDMATMYAPAALFYGVKSLDEFDSPNIKKLMYDSSAINFLSKDDPPVFLSYTGELTPTPVPEDTDINIIIHHPKFGEVLKQRMDELGLECILRHKNEPARPGEELEFLREHLDLNSSS